jgi:hypothetical protein
MRSLVRDAVPDYVRQAYDEVEKLQRINGEIENGEFLRVVELRKTNGIKYVGRVGEVLKTEKKKKSSVDLDDLNWNSVILEREVRKAILKAKKLKTERVELKKTAQTKQNADDIVHLALQGKSGAVLRRLLTIANAGS